MGKRKKEDTSWVEDEESIFDDQPLQGGRENIITPTTSQATAADAGAGTSLAVAPAAAKQTGDSPAFNTRAAASYWLRILVSTRKDFAKAQDILRAEEKVTVDASCDPKVLKGMMCALVNDDKHLPLLPTLRAGQHYCFAAWYGFTQSKSSDKSALEFPKPTLSSGRVELPHDVWLGAQQTRASEAAKTEWRKAWEGRCGAMSFVGEFLGASDAHHPPEAFASGGLVCHTDGD
jgi:hypothetical protein